MPNALALVAFFAAAVSQIALLGAVAFHRAGGWGNEGLAFGIFCLLASIPLGLIGASVLRAPRKRLCVGACAWFLTTLSLGLLFAYLALSQYGHGTPLILLMGYVLQSIAAVTTWREFRSAA